MRILVVNNIHQCSFRFSYLHVVVVDPNNPEDFQVKVDIVNHLKGTNLFFLSELLSTVCMYRSQIDFNKQEEQQKKKKLSSFTLKRFPSFFIPQTQRISRICCFIFQFHSLECSSSERKKEEEKKGRSRYKGRVR